MKELCNLLQKGSSGFSICDSHLYHHEKNNRCGATFFNILKIEVVDLNNNPILRRLAVT